MKNSYNHLKIEENWRYKWYKDNIYKAVDFSDKPKKYILAELPYPSGEYLHAGHMMRYTVPEVYSRFLRMQGYNVLFPMGWDSFGLPAETFALQSKQTPQQVIAKAEVNFKEAMNRMGYAIDWDREINTSDPEYYKWTQWMFLKMFEAGLVEQKEMPVWWCKELGVLADEEVETDSQGNRVSERGGFPVERKNFKQWNLKITDYADRLLDGLEDTNYTDPVKHGQINWIGKKVGANVDWQVDDLTLITFTTRQDTIFGVTFLVISPEHPLVTKLISNSPNKDEILNYIQRAGELSDLERQTKEKTGVQIKGVFASHPFEEVSRQIPIFVADYVLADYGTGVVQGVPAHDERDYEFAQKYDLEVIQVIQPPANQENEIEQVYTGDGILINSDKYNGTDSQEFKEIVLERLQKENKGEPATTYKLRDQIWSRQRYWGDPIPLIYTQDGKIEPDWDLPVEIPEITPEDVKNRDDFPPLSEFEDFINTTDSNGNPAKREGDTMPTWAGSNWYFIRYIDPKNSKEFAAMEKMKYWLPVDKYFGDAGHTTAHLLYARFWCKFLYDQGYLPLEEPFDWRASGGLLLAADSKKMSKSRPEYSVNPKDLSEKYGADATRMVLCFLGPYDENYPWNPQAVGACYKVLNTIYNLQDKVSNKDSSSELTSAYHLMIKNLTEMLGDLKMNTAVSEIMIFTNKAKSAENISTEIWEGFVKAIAPIAPFLAEELWQKHNNYTEWKPENSVHLQEWPKFDENLAVGDTFSLPIQINGKLRSTIEVQRGTSEKEIKKLVLTDEIIKKQTQDQEIKKFIYIPEKIVNLVV